jgi:hypothetical protein
MSSTKSSPQDERRYSFALPSLGEYLNDIIDPLVTAIEPVDRLASSVGNATADRRELWDARLERPPTLEDLGAYVVFLDRLDDSIDELRRHAETFRAALARLDTLRINGCTTMRDA